MGAPLAPSRHASIAMTVRATATYVYCLVAAPRAPRMPHGIAGPAGTGPVRLLAVSARQWLVVSNAPLARFGEAAINARLSDVDWVARAAVAHERVIEAFLGAPAVLPMKLFTIFAGDTRALEQMKRDRPRIDGLLKRVSRRNEWGVRVVFEPTAAPTVTERSVGRTGIAYLAAKKARRVAATELVERAREAAGGVYERLSRHADAVRRRRAGESPANGGPLLLDAAFLVPASKTARFCASAARQARALERAGCRLTLTGPWPPYTFIQD